MAQDLSRITKKVDCTYWPKKKKKKQKHSFIQSTSLRIYCTPNPAVTKMKSLSSSSLHCTEGESQANKYTNKQKWRVSGADKFYGEKIKQSKGVKNKAE
jgi:hypothetical protein